MKRILSTCLLGVVLASSALAQPASAQIQVILGGNQRHDWREQQLERDRQYRLQLERDRQHRLELERQRQRRLELERDRQRRLEIERQRQRQNRLEERRNYRDRY
ncbi:hypothetical protein [Nostoc sp. 106C]|uniref:hypothetical protein n=1 Tax=Nostoc sp. 106C TaxID=1932667 RepID=UPI000A37DA3B|nr:hypothetical protein [Nostoc sp. 106C]OUL17330.1 hypothetical protein BV378_38540 [Nostoc sp. RF31YmG]OUL17686.1 hypothetical protein BV375_35350 [Nostoc sp. 106C]